MNFSNHPLLSLSLVPLQCKTGSFSSVAGPWQSLSGYEEDEEEGSPACRRLLASFALSGPPEKEKGYQELRCDRFETGIQESMITGFVGSRP